MPGPFRVDSQSFEHFNQKLLMQALSWYHVYDNTGLKKLEDFVKIFDTARTAAGLTNWREGLESCLNGAPGVLYSCYGGLEGAGLVVRVVTKSTYDGSKTEQRDMLTPFGSQVLSLIRHWESCSADEEAGLTQFPISTRGVQVWKE